MINIIFLGAIHMVSAPVAGSVEESRNPDTERMKVLTPR